MIARSWPVQCTQKALEELDPDSGTAALALVKTQFLIQTRIMPITLDQIVEETREMPAEVVSELVDRIMFARHGGVEPSVATAWKTETDRRIAEIESGKVKGIPLEESLARARQIAGL